MNTDEEKLIASAFEARRYLVDGDEVKAAREQLEGLSQERQDWIAEMRCKAEAEIKRHEATMDDIHEKQLEGVKSFDLAEKTCNDLIGIAEASYAERLAALRAYYAGTPARLPSETVTMNFEGQDIELPMEMDPARNIRDVLSGAGDAGADIETVIELDGSLRTRIRRPAQVEPEGLDFSLFDEDVEKQA